MILICQTTIIYSVSAQKLSLTMKMINYLKRFENTFIKKNLNILKSQIYDQVNEIIERQQKLEF